MLKTLLIKFAVIRMDNWNVVSLDQFGEQTAIRIGKGR